MQGQDPAAEHGCGDAASEASASQLDFLELLSEPAEGDQAEKWFCLPAWPGEPPEVSENRATRMEKQIAPIRRRAALPTLALRDPLAGSRASPIRKH